MTQILLYNQFRKDYIIPDCNNILYIHYNWKIFFNEKELKINTFSKVLDYAMSKNFLYELSLDWYNTNYFISDDFYKTIFEYSTKNEIRNFKIIKPIDNYFYKKLLEIQLKLKEKWIILEFYEDNYSFFINHNDFLKKFSKPPVMETFYRFMRKKFNILMDWENPIWWAWNFDKENRKFDKNSKPIWHFDLEKNIFLKEAEKFYNFKSEINYPTCKSEALKLLDYFIKNHLDNFWKLEDAMYQNDNFVNHSLLSNCINFWILSPKEVVEKIEKTNTLLNNKEWFIRQILWWREYMYHFFTFYKETIYKNNFLNHTKKLDWFFRWENIDDLKMNCLKCILKKVNKYNYSHHIERLMIIWNFSLLYWYDPFELNRWFFENYTDAFEWVVSPNVLSMSQYVDWWLLATKPYISSWNYINNMSDYCKNCFYDVKTKYETNSCPFNYLYWNFVDKNKEIFQKTRQPFVVKNLEKIDLNIINKLKESFKL